jgi:hypothetical protein
MDGLFTTGNNAAQQTAQAQPQTNVIFDLIRGNFGQGQLFIRCLSLNADGASRCKCKSKAQSLFCPNHCKGGVIASTELKAAYQEEPDLLRPFLILERVPGRIFETRNAKEDSKVRDNAPKLARKVDRNNCVTKKGQLCTTPTKYADGYCHHHRGQIRNEEPVAQPIRVADLVEEEEEEEMDEATFAPIGSRIRSKRRGVSRRK